MNLSVAFTEPTSARMAVLMVGMILARGRRTIAAALRVMGLLACGHFTAYRQVSERRVVPIRWVYVVDQQGTHRDDCIFSTDATRAPGRIVGLLTRRWSIEVTFEEVRAHLGFETTRQRVAKSVLRMAPCLLGLFSAISLAFAAYNRRHRVHPATTPWYEKTDLTCSDALACVHRLLWEQTVFGTSRYAKQCAKLTPGLRNLLFECLSPAA